MKTVKELVLEKAKEFSSPLSIEMAIQRIEEENCKEVQESSAQAVAVSCDAIIQASDCWHKGYKLLMFRIEDIIHLAEPRAISDFESRCLYELLIKDNMEQLSRADLAMTEIQLLDIRNALDLFFDEDIKARNILTSIIQIHLPTPVENASACDYLHAYALGLNKDMLIEGVTRHLYEGPQFSGMVFDMQKGLVKYEDDWLEGFYQRVKRAHGCDYTDSEEKLLEAKEDMASTVDLYNTLTAYRVLRDIKQDLVHAHYYAKEYPEVLSFVNLFD